MTRLSNPPNVWVRDQTRNTPAHRVTDPERHIGADGKPAVVFRIACPPGVMAGGEIITRAAAAELAVFPCARCWNLTPVRSRTVR
jgi:hypothetical protein